MEKITIVHNDANVVQAIIVTRNGREHCTSDIRTRDFDVDGSICVCVSRSTVITDKKPCLGTVINRMVEKGHYKKTEIELEKLDSDNEVTIEHIRVEHPTLKKFNFSKVDF